MMVFARGGAECRLFCGARRCTSVHEDGTLQTHIPSGGSHTNRQTSLDSEAASDGSLLTCSKHMCLHVEQVHSPVHQADCNTLKVQRDQWCSTVLIN